MRRKITHFLVFLTACIMTLGTCLPVCSAAASEITEITASDYLTDRAGSLLVHVSGDRDIRVKIVKQTEEGAITYYNTLLEGMGTYQFWLDSCEYDIASEGYRTSFSITVLDDKDSGCAYTQQGVLVYDTGFSTDVADSVFTWTVDSVEAESRAVIATPLTASMDGDVWRGTCEVTLQYIPYTLGDIDSDGKIDMKDAYNTLMYTSKVAMGQKTSFTDDPSGFDEIVAFSAADINKNLEIEMTDAYFILLYSSYISLGQTPDWETIMK